MLNSQLFSFSLMLTEPSAWINPSQYALSPESRASWKKLASEESLTVKDWQNIAAGCSALAGVTRGGVGHYKANVMAKGTKTDNFNITASDGK